MRSRNLKFLVRKAHRYLGLVIGIQFIFWTLGGVYFSWTNIDQVRGDDLRKELNADLAPATFGSPQAALEQLKATDPAAKMMKIQTVNVLGQAFYEISLHGGDGKMRSVLASTADGSIRKSITEDEARRIAMSSVKVEREPVGMRFLTAEMIGADHEYREKPIPAWAVEFDGGLMVYVGAENGQIGAVRNTRWRVFDFLWMLHTLDFKARDDINNWLLRTLSLLGLVTIGSGLALFIVSSKRIRGIFRRTAE